MVSTESIFAFILFRLSARAPLYPWSARVPGARARILIAPLPMRFYRNFNKITCVLYLNCQNYWNAESCDMPTDGNSERNLAGTPCTVVRTRVPCSISASASAALHLFAALAISAKNSVSLPFRTVPTAAHSVGICFASCPRTLALPLVFFGCHYIDLWSRSRAIWFVLCTVYFIDFFPWIQRNRSCSVNRDVSEQ